MNRMHWTPAHVSQYERQRAYELQELAERVRGSDEPTSYMKVISSTGDGWVELQADYLEALLQRLEAGVGS